MKLSKLALIAAIACGVNAVNLSAQANDVQQVSFCAAESCDCGEPVCGCEPVCADPACGCEAPCCEEDPCCDSACCDGGCDSCGCPAAGCLSGFGLCGDCEHGDPFTLFEPIHGIDFGGWASVGYHSAALPIFNDSPDEVNLHQGWLWAEKAIDTSNGFDIGGRIDYVYGIDAQNTQAFGIDNDHWDNGWDNGNYGHAIPQLYGEVGYGDLSVKFGHFYTIIGYEVVQATGNFFYSHAYTFNYSEPFTHTGALATYNASDDLTLYSGYVMGWDSGFEDNGDAFLGGASLQVTEDWNLTYASVTGRFNDTIDDGLRGYMQSIVSNHNLSDKLNYVLQNDWLTVEDGTGIELETFDINQYLFYTMNDCWAVGTRFEWYNTSSTAGVADGNVYALTAGLNYKPTANITIRPEIRHDWVFGNPLAGLIALEDGDDTQFTFGTDAILTF